MGGVGRWPATLLLAGATVAVGLASGCLPRRERVEIEVEETITTTVVGNTTTTVKRGPAPGWERRGER